MGDNRSKDNRSKDNNPTGEIILITGVTMKIIEEIMRTTVVEAISSEVLKVITIEVVIAKEDIVVTAKEATVVAPGAIITISTNRMPVVLWSMTILKLSKIPMRHANSLITTKAVAIENVISIITVEASVVVVELKVAINSRHPITEAEAIVEIVGIDKIIEEVTSLKVKRKLVLETSKMVMSLKFSISQRLM